MIKCLKQYPRNVFRGWNASSKVRLIYLQELKPQESYGWCFWRLNESTKLEEIILQVAKQ